MVRSNHEALNYIYANLCDSDGALAVENYINAFNRYKTFVTNNYILAAQYDTYHPLINMFMAPDLTDYFIEARKICYEQIWNLQDLCKSAREIAQMPEEAAQDRALLDHVKSLKWSNMEGHMLKVLEGREFTAEFSSEFTSAFSDESRALVGFNNN